MEPLTDENPLEQEDPEERKSADLRVVTGPVPFDADDDDWED